MNSKSIGFALVGCGRVAYRHAEAITQSQNGRLVAVCDLKKERAEELGKRFGVPFYLNYHEMLRKHPEAAVVNVITPSGMHFEHAADLIGTHRRNLLIEKPMVMAPAQGIALKRIADKAGVRVYPVFQNRFNKAVQKVKAELVTGGSLGQVRCATVRMRWCRPQRYYDLSEWRGKFSMDGGAVTNQGIHYIDLLRYLAGDVKRVCSKLGTLGASIEVEDTAVSVVEFESGALGVIEVMTSARPIDFEASISIVGSEGLAVIAGIATNELTTFSPAAESCKMHSEVFPTVYGFGHNEVVERVALDLLGRAGDCTPTEFEDALNTIRLLHGIYSSDETQHWVEMSDSVQSQRLGRPDDRLASLYRTPKI